MLRFFILLVFLFNANICFGSILNNGNFSSNFNHYRQYPNNYNVNNYNSYPRSHYSQYNNYNRLSRQNLDALEKYAFQKRYSGENDISRLERLESLAFGSVQHGDILSRYRNVENAILSRPQNNYKRSILNSIGNYIAGRATGVTPSITTDSFPTFKNIGGFNTFNHPLGGSFSPNYTNSTIQQYSNGIFGGGWGIQNQNFGNGSGIKILD